MNVLLVEDEDPKLAPVLRYLEEQHPDLIVSVVRSVKSALAALREQIPDLLLLDMSLPTFDISESEPGGRPQGFGGIEIVRYLDSVDARVPIIVLSAYEAFSRDGKNIQLKTLGSEMMRDYPELIIGIVYFNPIQGIWGKELSDAIYRCRLIERGSQ
jgi:CheY-like chemotaxis protein